MNLPALRNRWLIPAIIIAAIAAAYAADRRGPFIFDDGNAIVDNPHIRSVWPLTESMSAPPQNVLVGRPLISLSFALNYQLGGLDPLGYHIFNIASHIACALLLYGLVRRTLILRRWNNSGEWFAGAAALLWGLHPIQTEAVSYVTQRTETFMSMFLLLTLYSLVRAAQSPARKIAWRCVAVAACAAGMGCKEIMIVTPLLAMLYDWIFFAPAKTPPISARKAQSRTPKAELRTPIRDRGRFLTHMALLVTVLIVPLELRNADMESKSGYGLKYVHWFDYLKTQTGVILHYLTLVIFPSGQTISYFNWPITRSILPAILPGMFLLILLILTVIACLRRWWPGFLGAWFFLILGPTSSVLPNFTEIAAERRMYLPLAAIVILFLLAIWKLKTRAAIVAVLCVTLGGLTIARNYTYHSALSIWTDAVTKRPDNALAHYFLARAYADAGDWDRAMFEDDMSLRLESRLAAPAALHQRILQHYANPQDTPALPPGRPGA